MYCTVFLKKSSKLELKARFSAFKEYLLKSNKLAILRDLWLNITRNEASPRRFAEFHIGSPIDYYLKEAEF